MIERIITPNNYLFEIFLSTDKKEIVIRNLINNKESFISIFEVTEEEIGKVFNLAIEYFWTENNDILKKCNIINLTKIENDINDTNNQIMNSFVEIFSRELEIIKDDILKKKEELE